MATVQQLTTAAKAIAIQTASDTFARHAIALLYAGRSTLLDGDEPHRAVIEAVMGRRMA